TSSVIGLLVATALPARDRAVAPFDRGGHHAAALSWADGDAAWANADGGVIAPTIPIVAVVAIPPDLYIDALGHLELLGLGGSSRRGRRQHRGGCRYGKSDLHHPGVLLGLIQRKPQSAGLGALRRRPQFLPISEGRALRGRPQFLPFSERRATWNE